MGSKLLVHPWLRNEKTAVAPIYSGPTFGSFLTNCASMGRKSGLVGDDLALSRLGLSVVEFPAIGRGRERVRAGPQRIPSGATRVAPIKGDHAVRAAEQVAVSAGG